MTRRRFFGDTTIAQAYTGQAEVWLAMLEHDMRYADLQQAVRRRTLPNGVEVQVSMRFGQGEVQIYAPPPGAVVAPAEEVRVTKVPEEPWVPPKIPEPEITRMVVAGVCTFPDGSYRPVIWDDGGPPLDVGTLPGYSWGWVGGLGVRDGMVYAAVNSEDKQGNLYAAAVSVWFAGAHTDIGLFAQPAGAPSRIAANAMSRDGSCVAGWGLDTDYSSAPYVWDAENGVRRVTGLTRGNGAEVYQPSVSAISADGKVVCGGGPYFNAPGWVKEIDGVFTEWDGAGNFIDGLQYGDTLYMTPHKSMGLSADGGVAVGIHQYFDAGLGTNVGRAARWTVGQGVEYLAGPGSAASAVADDGVIAVGGVIVGTHSFGGVAIWQAAKFFDGEVTALGEAPGFAVCISASGLLSAGSIGTFGVDNTPVWWDAGGVQHALPLLEGATMGVAYAIIERDSYVTQVAPTA